MEPIQLQVPLAQYTYNKALDFVAARVSEIFNAHGKKHVFFGGYAVTVLGGSRMTNVSCQISHYDSSFMIVSNHH